jgi:hypothetical protein
MKKKTATVPKNYTDLQKHYGTYIQTLLNRYNKVERNFEDLHSYIWVKIMEARLLERFNAHITSQVPKVVTGLTATDVLGCSWEQWITAHQEFHVQGKVSLDMPLPINEPQLTLEGKVPWEQRDALYALSDVLGLTIERDIDGKWRTPIHPMGLSVEDGKVVGGPRREGCLKIPVVEPTPAQFKGYLTRSVLNSYANFCRTLSRRHKERPALARNHPGDEESIWEATLEDERAASQEIHTCLNEAQELIDHHLNGTPEGEELQKIVFSKMEEGTSLLQALRDTNVNPRVRKILLRALTR